MQWLLLILVVAAVAGAYYYLRRQSGDDPWRDMEESGDPSELGRGESLGGESYIVGVRTVGEPATPSADPEPSNEAPAGPSEVPGGEEPSWQAFTTEQAAPESQGRAEAVRPQRPPTGEERLFILHVHSKDGALFDGPDVHQALQDQKLKFGLNDIYHRITEANGVPESVYGVANMLKPGYLDPVEQDHLRTPGVTFFLQLPGPIEGAHAARDMLETASALAERLDAQVLDDKRSLLKPQTAQYMLDEVVELDRRRQLAGQR